MRTLVVRLNARAFSTSRETAKPEGLQQPQAVVMISLPLRHFLFRSTKMPLAQRFFYAVKEMLSRLSAIPS
ncbi:MAG: hypothetical protein K6L75_05855 [Cellvibrionaceae bacterium]